MRFTWHMVINADGVILAAYGSALKSEAEEKVRELRRLSIGTNDSIELFSLTMSKRPRVGDVVSARQRKEAKAQEERRAEKAKQTEET